MARTRPWTSRQGLELADLVPAELRRSWADQGHYPGEDLYRLFTRQVHRHPDRPAVIDPTGSLTYAELADRVGCFAEAMRGAGIADREIVALRLPNGWPAVAAELAVAALGSVALTFPDGRGSADAFSLLHRSRASGLVATAATARAVLAEADTRLPHLRAAFTVGGEARGAVRLPGGEASPGTAGSALPGPVSPGSALPGPVSPGSALPGPVSPGSALPGPVSPGSAASGPVSPGSAASGPVSPGSAASGSALPGSAASGPVSPGPVSPGPAASGRVSSGPAWPGSASAGLAALPASPGPAMPAPASPGSALPGPALPGLAPPAGPAGAGRGAGPAGRVEGGSATGLGVGVAGGAELGVGGAGAASSWGGEAPGAVQPAEGESAAGAPFPARPAPAPPTGPAGARWAGSAVEVGVAPVVGGSGHGVGGAGAGSAVGVGVALVVGGSGHGVGGAGAAGGAVDPGGPARVLVSSGSEAEPKMIAYSHDAMAGGRGNYLRAVYAGTAVPRALVMVPLASSYGSLGVVTLYRHGGTLVLLDGFDAPAAMRAIAVHRPTHVFGVATMVQRMLAVPSEPGERFSFLRALVLSCDGVPAPLLAAALERFGCPVSNLYGSSDGVNCRAEHWRQSEDTTLLGRPDPAVCGFRSCDEQGRPLPVGVAGELWALGPMTPLCYVGAPELDARRRSGGWVRTGDHGLVTAEGRVRLLRRNSQVVKRGGYSISPAEVERHAATHPDLAEAVCVAVPDPEFGERLCVCVVARPGRPAPALPELNRHLEEVRGLERRKLPEQLVPLAALPLGATGKLSRVELVRQATVAATATATSGAAAG
ncbi:AMP-binding protein [Kitasatospora sp. LaBMicrA B282]|uniref:class I adenylate-forming enzyme family protein n=1 Tax=Kitasatospora sp. LaBMicrA B282 TaxID=3420949 RepID=UPI003D1274F4